MGFCIMPFLMVIFLTKLFFWQTNDFFIFYFSTCENQYLDGTDVERAQIKADDLFHFCKWYTFANDTLQSFGILQLQHFFSFDYD